MSLLRSASSSFSAQALSSVITIPGMIFLSQLVGSSILGKYFLILAALNLLTILTDFGIGSSVVRYERENGSGQFFGAALLSRGAIVFVVCITVIFAGELFRSYFGFKFEQYLISMYIVEQIRGLLNHIISAENKVGVASWIQASGTVLRILTQLALVVVFGTAPNLLIVGHIISILGASVFSIYVIDTVPSMPTSSEFSKLLNFGIRDYFNGVETFGAEWIDSLLIGAFLSPSAVGIYEIAWGISRNLYTVSDAVSRSLYPRLVKAVSDSSTDDVERLLQMSFTYSPIFIFPGFVGFYILGDPILSLYGEEFVTGYSVALVLIAARLFQGVDTVFKNLFRARTIPFSRARVSPLIVLFNIGMGAILIPNFGILGAGTATMLSFIIGPLIGLSTFEFGYKTVVSTWRDQVIASVGMGATVLLLQNVLGDGVLQLLLLILSGAVSYATLLYLINRELISMVLSSIAQNNLEY